MSIESLTSLKTLPDSARVWIYAADRTLDESEQERLIESLESFCGNWSSHGRRVESAATVLEGRFAVISGDIPGGDISGCGIDASVHALDKAAEELDFGWLPALAVHFRSEDGSISSASRADFRSMVKAGQVHPRTSVFDLSIETLGALRGGRLERPAEATWHGRVFRLTGTGVSS